jgi:hypothetical protein
MQLRLHQQSTEIGHEICEVSQCALIEAILSVVLGESYV